MRKIGENLCSKKMSKKWDNFRLTNKNYYFYEKNRNLEKIGRKIELKKIGKRGNLYKD